MEKETGTLEIQNESRQYAEILTPDCLSFVAELVQKFGDEIPKLLDERRRWRDALVNAKSLQYSPATLHIRENKNWKVASPPPGLTDRRVEIVCPASIQKMVKNNIAGKAQAVLFDGEDSVSPTGKNVMTAHDNVREAVHERSAREGHATDASVTVMYRPRGLHMEEKNVCVNGRTVAAFLWDIGIFLYNNARTLIDFGHGPYMYIPKLELPGESAFVNRVLLYCENRLGIPEYACNVTFLIETLPGSLHKHEILYECRQRVSGLNGGLWDYITSYLKYLSDFPEYVLPDRSEITKGDGFVLRNELDLVRVCTERGAQPISGMHATLIGGSADEQQKIAEIIYQDKVAKAGRGHVGTWVAQPSQIPFALKAQESYVAPAYSNHDDPSVEYLLEVPKGSITKEGLLSNMVVAIEYWARWLSGIGCSGIFGKMEDVATASAPILQIIQWKKHSVVLDTGERVTDTLIRDVFAQAQRIVCDGEFAHREYEQNVSEKDSAIIEASAIIRKMWRRGAVPESLTDVMYPILIEREHRGLTS